MSHKRTHFYVKVREPYMGNLVPIRLEVRVPEEGDPGSVQVFVKNPEGILYVADQTDPQVFNE